MVMRWTELPCMTSGVSYETPYSLRVIDPGYSVFNGLNDKPRTATQFTSFHSFGRGRKPWSMLSSEPLVIGPLVHDGVLALS